MIKIAAIRIPETMPQSDLLFHLLNGIPPQWQDGLDHRAANLLKTVVGRRLLLNLFHASFPDKGHPHIETGPLNIPFFKDRSACFSISHSDHFVVCALSDSPIGIDIETIKNFDKGLLKKMYSPVQQDFVSESANKQHAFFSIWTAREAVFKAARNPEKSLFSRIEGLKGNYHFDGAAWTVLEIPINAGLVCNIAFDKKSEPGDIAIYRLKDFEVAEPLIPDFFTNSDRSRINKNILARDR